ncbi:hypothetical protein Tco_0988666 [Tanacetum coccineum]|uniref:Uncharacterized protein n=1 Tax=Tanacetum coccineum TaxID=301880 RepID=A0ABQ5ERS6_9ASTR
MGVGCRGGVGEVVRWWYDDDDDAMVCCGGVTVGRQRRCGWSGEVLERVRESGYGDRIDRKMGSVFGVGRKNPAGKVFRRRSSDGGGGRRWWPAAGGYERERVGEFGIILLFHDSKSLSSKRSKFALYSLITRIMLTANQDTLAESGAEGKPPILEKGSYVPWASRFFRFLDSKREEGER